MDQRTAALDLAAHRFDSGAFEERLARLVSVKSTSHDPRFLSEMERYVTDEMTPWLEQMGFAVEVHPNTVPGIGPILFAERIEASDLPCVVTYGHGDTVLGMDDAWTCGAGPWTLKRDGDRWYGRGTADNKGQHAINLFALESVLQARGGKLGFNVKLVLEMAEERSSKGLRRFVETMGHRLGGDVFIASDGPRVAPDTPTVAAGSRGTFRFDLVVSPRTRSVHSGHWGGLTTDPAVVLSNAIASICDKRGKVLVRSWLPNGGESLDPATRELLRDCTIDGGTDAAKLEPDWGEPGLRPAEKLYAWNSFIVLAMKSGVPEAPENTVSPVARATCHLRYTPATSPDAFIPALREHLDREGFSSVRIENAGVGMPASATDPGSPWIAFAAQSLRASLDRHVQVIPCTSGGMPGDIFQDLLGLPLVWIPHGHNACGQHGLDEHMLIDTARSGVLGMAGLWWDMATAKRAR
jgi:acetylornithine deacetylase/succinyl-diaminopimelate desuccinylase-like protein